MAGKIETIFIVRADFRNGLHLEMNYSEPHLGNAKAAYETIRVAKDQSLVCEVFDDAGRALVIDGKEIQAVQMVDLVQESNAALAIAERVDDVRASRGYARNMAAQMIGAQATGGPANGSGERPLSGQVGAIGATYSE